MKTTKLNNKHNIAYTPCSEKQTTLCSIMLPVYNLRFQNLWYMPTFDFCVCTNGGNLVMQLRELLPLEPDSFMITNGRLRRFNTLNLIMLIRSNIVQQQRQRNYTDM